MPTVPNALALDACGAPSKTSPFQVISNSVKPAATTVASSSARLFVTYLPIAGHHPYESLAPELQTTDMSSAGICAPCDTPDNDDNHELYGRPVTARKILVAKRVRPRSEAEPFMSELARADRPGSLGR